MQFSNEEQETIIRYDRANDDCLIYTSDRTVMTRLDKLYKCVRVYQDADGVYAKEYRTCKRWISFRTDPNYKPAYMPQRKITVEQLARMQKGREQRNGQTAV